MSSFDKSNVPYKYSCVDVRKGSWVSWVVCSYITNPIKNYACFIGVAKYNSDFMDMDS